MSSLTFHKHILFALIIFFSQFSLMGVREYRYQGVATIGSSNGFCLAHVLSNQAPESVYFVLL